MISLLAQFELAAPYRLAALAIVLIVLLAGWFSLTRHARGRRVAMTVCRALAIAALVLAWAGLAWRGPTSRMFVVEAIDRSDSATGSTEEKAPARDAQLPFAGETGPAADALSTRAPSPQDTSSIKPQASDLALAVTRAAALIPDDRVGHVVLRSDGRATHDGLLAAAAAQGVPIHAVESAAFPQPEICVAEIVAPQNARPIKPFDLEVVITSNHDDQGRLELQLGDKREVREVSVKAGANRFSFQAVLTKDTPSLELAATFSGGRDTYPANNHRTAIVFPGTRPRVLMAASIAAAAERLRSALDALGYHVAIVAPGKLPVEAAILGKADVIVLADVRPQELSRPQQVAIDQFVREGGGLLAFGGEKMLGRQPLAGTWLETILPLSAAQEQQRPKPTLALVLVIDKSESMGKERRLELAKEAARRTIGLEVIAPTDQIGILAFGDDAQWISPLEPCGDKRRLLAAIEPLKGEGMTNMAAAMQRARLALAQSTADRRHVILLSDGGDGGVSTPGDFDRIARAMYAAGITLSTVTISPGADQTILRDIAPMAGGRHYHCDDPRQLPGILVDETRSTAQPIAAEPFRPLVYRPLPGLNVAAAPPLAGYVPLNPKPEAELLLLTPGGDPLLARGVYGRGRVTAIAADMTGAAAAEWQRWEGFGPFFATLVEQSLPKREPPFLITTARRFGRLRVVMEANPAAKSTPRFGEAILAVSTSAADGTKTTPTDLKMQNTVPDRYEATVDSTAEGIYDLSIRIGSAQQPTFQHRLAVTVDYPDELQLGPIDRTLLSEVAKTTGGRLLTSPSEAIAADGRTVDRLVRLWPALVMAAMLLLTLEIVLRRTGAASTIQAATQFNQFQRPMGVP